MYVIDVLDGAGDRAWAVWGVSLNPTQDIDVYSIFSVLRHLVWVETLRRADN